MAGIKRYTDYKNYRAADSFTPYISAMIGIVIVTFLGYGTQSFVAKATAADAPAFTNCNNLNNQTTSMSLTACSELKTRTKTVSFIDNLIPEAHAMQNILN
jgi:hypothetical protein